MISILIPIYNGIEFINESVNSVLQQTYTDWELIIGVNGHSRSSHVYEIASHFAKEDNKIRVLDLYTIKGKSNALNEMIKYCNPASNYIAILDVDDIWLPEKLEKQSPFLNKYDVIGTRCIWFGNREGIVPFIPTGDINSFDFGSSNPIINSTSLIRKELCFWKENGLEDYDLWLRLKKSGKSFYNIPDILIKHRIHQQSAFNSKGNHLLVDKVLKSNGYFVKSDLSKMSF